jgi:hypothetical protein
MMERYDLAAWKGNYLRRINNDVLVIDKKLVTFLYETWIQFMCTCGMGPQECKTD